MSETVRVYHGSKRGLEGAIRADRGYPTNDFGAGFYLGDEKSQPLTLICRGESPMLYTCDLDLTGLRVFRFADDRDWALFVAECETFREKSFNQRKRAIEEVERIRLRHLHDGMFFQEILEEEGRAK